MIPRGVFWSCVLELVTALVLAGVGLFLLWAWWT